MYERWYSCNACHLSDDDTEGRQHGHTAVLDLGLAPPLDVAGRGAVGQTEGVENLKR